MSTSPADSGILADQRQLGISQEQRAFMNPPTADSGMLDQQRLNIGRKQRFQDFIFHKLTLSFSLIVLVSLIGIIASLAVVAWPALQKFGIGFIWRVEWDIINEEFGAAIAIFGTLASATIAILIAMPLSFGIALFLTETCPTWLRRPLGTAIELLAGKGNADAISERLIVAYWLFGRDNESAIYHWSEANKNFAALADALGYTIAPKEVAPVEAAA